MAIEPGKHHFPMTGIEIWKNPKNKFCVFQCHYTADPAKRSEEYRKEKMASLPRKKFLMEYELHWESYSGLPIFGDTWNERVHTTKEDIEPELGLPLLIGWDWGLTPSAIVCQLHATRLFAYREFVAVNMGAKRFIALVKKELSLLYPGWSDLRKDVIAFIDPSGRFRKDTDEGTCANILIENGFTRIVDGAISFEERRTSVEDFLLKMQGGLPCFTASAAYCPILIKGFNGAYHFEEGQDELETKKLQAVKNEVSHVHDALQGITSKIMKMSTKSRVNIPMPSYIWANR